MYFLMALKENAYFKPEDNKLPKWEVAKLFVTAILSLFAPIHRIKNCSQ